MESNQKTFIYGFLALLVGFGGWYGYTYWQDFKTDREGSSGYSEDDQAVSAGSLSTFTLKEIEEQKARFVSGKITSLSNKIVSIEERDGSVSQVKINNSTEFLKFLDEDAESKIKRTEIAKSTDLKPGLTINVNLDESTLSDPAPLATRIAIK